MIAKGLVPQGVKSFGIMENRGAAGRGSVGWMHIGLCSLSRDSIG
jgi:hypothetical protein